MDERFCVYCFQERNDLESLFLNENILCSVCQSQFEIHKKTYRVNGIFFHILYVYNDFLQSMIFQYKEQRDVVLAPVFLESQKWLKKKLKQYNVCGMCSSELKRNIRGFEPVLDMFSCIGINVRSPFYRLGNQKQASRNKKERSKIEDEIFLKNLRFPDRRPICLVDDVITTGATLHRGIELLHPDCVFVLAAHPLWIQEHEKDEVRSSFFTHS